MESLEFFRAKSRRRSRPLTHEKAAKGAVLFILFASLTASVFMWGAGLPR